MRKVKKTELIMDFPRTPPQIASEQCPFTRTPLPLVFTPFGQRFPFFISWSAILHLSQIYTTDSSKSNWGLSQFFNLSPSRQFLVYGNLHSSRSSKNEFNPLVSSIDRLVVYNIVIVPA